MKESLLTFCKTDLASELFQTGKEAKQQPHCRRDDTGGILSETLTVSNAEESAALGKSIGTYYTIHTKDLRYLTKEQADICISRISGAVQQAAEQLLHAETDAPVLKTSIDDPGILAQSRTAASPEWERGETEDLPEKQKPIITAIPPLPEEESERSAKPSSVLIVGLGNSALTPDAFGPACVRHLHVTRHLTGEPSPLPEELRSGLCAVSAFCPSVVGQTGIETLSLVRAAADAVSPNLVVLLDALAASRPESLAHTVQISTTGIHPGSGLGNHRAPIVRETIGCPVMTIGVPTVISASTLIYRTLEQCRLLPSEEDASCQALHQQLRLSAADYVAPKDIDTLTELFARLIASVLNNLFLGKETAEAFSMPV